VLPGQCLYIKSRDNYNDGTNYTSYLASAMVPHNYSIVLTNDLGIIVTNSEGEAGAGAYGDNVITTVEIYNGSTKETGWSIEVTPSDGVSYEEVKGKDNTYKVTGLTADSGVLTFTATNALVDNVTLVTTFGVSKLKAGAAGGDGASATLCYIESSKGTLLSSGDTGKVKLTAKIFIGDTEFDKYENL
jgi:hypothetical protein